MFLRRSIAFATALALSGLGAAGFTQPAPTVQLNAPRRAKRGLFGGVQWAMPSLYGRKGPGISMAQQQRASRKKRNQARHKRHVRA